MAKVNINLPQFITFDDYHEIESLVYKLNCFGLKIKAKEIGFDGSGYVGFFYQGKLPSKKTLNKLIKLNSIMVEVEDY